MIESKNDHPVSFGSASNTGCALKGASNSTHEYENQATAATKRYRGLVTSGGGWIYCQELGKVCFAPVQPFNFFLLLQKHVTFELKSDDRNSSVPRAVKIQRVEDIEAAPIGPQVLTEEPNRSSR